MVLIQLLNVFSQLLFSLGQLGIADLSHQSQITLSFGFLCLKIKFLNLLFA